MTELIICEKPAQAEKIASALGKPTKHLIDKVSYYELEYKGKKILVGCAVGHLFNLAEKEKNGWKYPVSDIEWKPSYEINKKSDFSEKYLKVLEKLAKKASEFTVGCDFDAEGSLIGWNCIRFIAHQKDGKRMKFSTLTKDELIHSYENAMPHLDFPIIEAGEARHVLDWLAGINLSRALTLAVKSAGLFKLLSIGRVQGPALKIIVEREEEIKKFKPEPYWELFLDGKAKGKEIHAVHEAGRIFDKKQASSLFKKTNQKPAIVESVEQKSSSIPPPPPFDLTTLQT
ncbi:MAG: DNA topoisomerase, partial [Nanoarchaeota archaeon]